MGKGVWMLGHPAIAHCVCSGGGGSGWWISLSRQFIKCFSEQGWVVANITLAIEASGHSLRNSRFPSILYSSFELPSREESILYSGERLSIEWIDGENGE